MYFTMHSGTDMQIRQIQEKDLVGPLSIAVLFFGGGEWCWVEKCRCKLAFVCKDCCKFAQDKTFSLDKKVLPITGHEIPEGE